MREWKDGINRLRTGTYGRLIALGSEQGKGPEWAESFFLSEGEGEAEEPEATDLPNAPAAPPGAPAGRPREAPSS